MMKRLRPSHLATLGTSLHRSYNAQLCHLLLRENRLDVLPFHNLQPTGGR